jgi:hypothetical protein
MTEWNTDIPMSGSFKVHWAVLRDDEGWVTVWQSPYQEFPPPEGEKSEDGKRLGKIAALSKPLNTYTDPELSASAELLASVAYDDFIEALLANGIFYALREQREREGGLVAHPMTLKKTEPEEG